jgi:histidine decarboxylase
MTPDRRTRAPGNALETLGTRPKQTAFREFQYPAAPVIYLTSHGSGGGSTVDYIATVDSTLAGSRSGHAPLLMWYAINTLGIDGLRARAHESWRVAAYAVDRLQHIGWYAWRHPHAMTVVLDTPPTDIATRWRLASSGGQSHIVAVPGVTTAKIETLVTQLATHAPARPPSAPWPMPIPRSPTYVEEGATDARR